MNKQIVCDVIGQCLFDLPAVPSFSSVRLDEPKCIRAHTHSRIHRAMIGEL